MRIESKHNRIVIVFNPAETKFLTYKAGVTKQLDVIAYVKAKVLKSLGLEDPSIKLASDFSLHKIRNIPVELNKIKQSSDALLSKHETNPDEEEGLISEDDLVEDAIEAELIEKKAAEEPQIDQLLEDLLDQDLLKRQKKGSKSPKNTPKSDKNKD
jgi:CO dehydrogenase nickel-insertion accessory protein CooC1